MFDLKRCYNGPIVALVVAPIHIKHVHSSVSYRWAIYKKYDRRGCESPSGYKPLGCCAYYLLPEVARGAYFHGRDVVLAMNYFFHNVLTSGFGSVQ